MSQKTFWAALLTGKVQHLWRRNPLAKQYIESACGMTYAAKGKVRTARKLARCKNCERAIAQ